MSVSFSEVKLLMLWTPGVIFAQFSVAATTPGCTLAVHSRRSRISPRRLKTRTRSPSAMPRCSRIGRGNLQQSGFLHLLHRRQIGESRIQEIVGFAGQQFQRQMCIVLAVARLRRRRELRHRIEPLSLQALVVKLRLAAEGVRKPPCAKGKKGSVDFGLGAVWRSSRRTCPGAVSSRSRVDSVQPGIGESRARSIISSTDSREAGSS